ncbi:MAG: aspartyl/asparaginyl beta-hydroxylase domain-containing protein [Bacteroidetes bacterium]|nr:aspartyl/asparaginyl beta-hydroxylase domain-containing protein [Bacteroidota bacterium]MBK8366600.1 aspartyl/asparaginyl beta-hydroxylase domain-containing protein [Bacteroidota bacterium]
MKQSSKLWFSIYNLNSTYSGLETGFIDPVNFDWSNDLKANINIIKEELEAYLKDHQLESYFNTSMVSKKNSWKTIALKNWSIELFKNQKHFPKTTELLNRYPQIISSSFNLLTANSKIHAHSGDTNAIYRCHIGIDVPEGLPNCGFRVKDELRSWENNKWMVFMDAYDHEAWNNSSKDRYIFLIDILRDEFKQHKQLVCSTVRTSLFLQKRAENHKVLLNLKQVHITLIAKVLRPFALVATNFCNFLKIF